jgi:type I restriction enzyme R subunit
LIAFSFEYAFYTAVANNKSAKELMQHDKLRELAVVLTERVKQNASIDWTIKESVRAKLKVIDRGTSGAALFCPSACVC